MPLRLNPRQPSETSSHPTVPLCAAALVLQLALAGGCAAGLSASAQSPVSEDAPRWRGAGSIHLSTFEPRRSGLFLGVETAISSPRGDSTLGLRNLVASWGYRWCCDVPDPELGVALGLGQPTSTSQGTPGSGVMLGATIAVPLLELDDHEVAPGFAPATLHWSLLAFVRVGAWTPPAIAAALPDIIELTFGVTLRVTIISDLFARSSSRWTR